ncbi:hypothetical protein DBA29_22545 [Xenophilus aerolatus]|nr:hypothetical protein [Xenophilus aerolatus]
MDATTAIAVAEAAGSKFGPLGYLIVLLILGVGTGIYWLLARNQQRLSGADTEGQIQALAVYKEMLKAERDARVTAEARADQFARELRDALQQLGELKGQLQAMTAELTRVRQELEQVKGQINGNAHG